MLSVSILAAAAGGCAHISAGVDPASRAVTLGAGALLTLGEASALSADAFILGGLTAEEVELPPASCLTVDELTYLAGEAGPEEGWTLRGEAGELDEEAAQAVSLLLRLLHRVENASERLRIALGLIAEEGGLPAALFALEADVLLPAENPYFAEDLRKDLPPRTRVAKDKAYWEQELPRQEDVFAKLKAGDFAAQGYEYRAEQESFARLVDEAISGGFHLILEAGTGVGKSLGYLIPALRHALTGKAPILISTNTKILQDQLLHSDYPKLGELLGTPLPSPVVLKGRENYLCLEKLRLNALTTRLELRNLVGELSSASDRPRELALALMGLALHLTESHSGDFEYIRLPEGLSAAATGRLRRLLSAAFRGCLRERCPLIRECYFYVQRDAAEHSPVAILNHALLFALANPEADADDPLASFVDKAEVLVLDEAHNLEEVLLDALGRQLSSSDLIEFVNRLPRLLAGRQLVTRLSLPLENVPADERDRFLQLKDLQALAPGAAEEVYNNFRKFNELLEAAHGALADRSDDWLRLDLTRPERDEVEALKESLLRLVTVFYERLIDLSEGLTRLAELTGGDAEAYFYIDDNRYQIQLREVVNCFAALKEGCAALLSEGDTWVKWVECGHAGRRGEFFWNLAACPVVVGDYFARLIEPRKSVVMVSGTLAVDGNFRYFKRGMGLTDFPSDRLREEMLASPFDYRRRALVLVPHDIPAPDFRDRQAHGRFLDALAETVAEAARVFGGATLVLFNSYADLNAVAAKLDGLKNEGFAVLTQERGASRFQLAGEFKATRKSVLLGVRSFWEGFDIRGEALQCVIISRLPFPNLHDPVTAGKVRYIDEHDGDSFNLYMLPSAIMKFKQGFGRLIRSTGDFGCVLLLDQRALTKRYGASFLRELPGPAIKKLPRRRIAEVLEDFVGRMRGGAR